MHATRDTQLVIYNLKWRLGAYVISGLMALLLSRGAPVGALPDSCPTVTIHCAAGEKCGGKRQKLTANVSGLPADIPELKFEWCVSEGRIISGQGTSAVEIDAGDGAGEGITVVVIVSGLAKECIPVASYWVKLSEGPDPGDAAPNNGIHPTAYTRVIKYFQWLGAGDVGR